MIFGKILIGACAKTKKKIQTTLILAIEIIVQPIIGRDIPSKSFENHVFSRNLDDYNY